MTTRRPKTPSRLKRRLWLHTAAFAPLVALSAVLTAASLASPGNAWLAWICLIPLLFAIRSLPPVLAGLAGAAWGLCFYSAGQMSPTPVVTPGIAVFGLLAFVPSVFCLLVSMATRALGFTPLIVALLWILVEAALQPLGLRGGLVAGTQGDSPVMQLARLLGYAFVAAVIVFVNAALVARISLLKAEVATDPAVSDLPLNVVLHSILYGAPASVCLDIRAYPRAPPFP